MAKTSDLAGDKQRGAPKRPNSLSLSRLAEAQGCSQRTIREWCKKRLIREAYQTDGCHWRISLPLSKETIRLLHRRSSDWPFRKSKRDFQGDWEPEFAEWLMLAQLFQQPLGEPLPVPTIAEQGDWEGILESTDPRARMAREIQDEIIRRLENGESFSDLLLMGWVYQFWLKEKRRPTVSEIADFMGLSRDTFYRYYNRAQIYRNLRIACGQVEARLPDPEGLDSAQRAKLKAKKPRFGSGGRDTFAHD
ncbi:MAG: hypothetical protein C5B58_04690 [Acidobacteria bacterium]|nr:MAG: hypothetical protein C5B58_04690 [Acidobacteriota bacterium]